MPVRRDLGVLGKPQTGIHCCCQDEGLFWGDADKNRRIWKEPGLSPYHSFLDYSVLVEANRERPRNWLAKEKCCCRFPARASQSTAQKGGF